MTVLAHDRPPLPARARPAVPDPSQPVAAKLGGMVAQPDAANRDGMKHDGRVVAMAPDDPPAVTRPLLVAHYLDDWGSGPQATKDRWVVDLRPDARRDEILRVKDGRPSLERATLASPA